MMTTPQEPGEDRLARIEAIVSRLEDNMVSMQNNMVSMQANMVSMQGDITSMKGDIASMQGNITGMKGNIASMQGDIAVTKGWQTELAVERRAGQVFARLCDGELLRVYPASELRYYINNGRRRRSITRADAERAESIDFLLEGVDGSGAPAMYAVEVSYTAGPDDIDRAVAKAGILTRLLQREIKPAVVGEEFTAHFAPEAAAKSVAYTYIRNGSSITR